MALTVESANTTECVPNADTNRSCLPLSLSLPGRTIMRNCLPLASLSACNKSDKTWPGWGDQSPHRSWNRQRKKKKGCVRVAIYATSFSLWGHLTIESATDTVKNTDIVKTIFGGIMMREGVNQKRTKKLQRWHFFLPSTGIEQTWKVSHALLWTV